jgi:feruloyl esterase
VGGIGAYPHTTFHALVDWVENGNAPSVLEATSQPDANGSVINRILCAYPKKAKYDGKGGTNDFGSYTCVD